MKVKYDLKPFGIDTSQKQIIDGNGKQLSKLTLETLLSLISSKYYGSDHQQVSIDHRSFSNITNTYRQYLDYLVDKGIILINEKYKVGKHSRKYLFADSFKEQATIKTFKREPKKDSQLNDGSFIVDNFVLERLQQDIRQVIIKNSPVEKEILFYQDLQPIVNFKKYLCNEFNLFLLRNGRRDIVVKAARIYTHFVHLSKDVRLANFSFEERLTSLDIKRSFPLWLTVWLIDNNIFMDYDTKEFISSVQSGKFYNDLLIKFNNDRNLFNNTGNDRPFFNRTDVKDLFSTWLNGDPNKKQLPNSIMRACYPLIFDFVKGYKKGDKNRMYYTLANMESNFILNTVCRRLYNEIPDIKLLTCHDEIYFEERFKPMVEKIWNAELQLVYDRLPDIRDLDIDFEFDPVDLELAGIYLD